MQLLLLSHGFHVRAYASAGLAAADPDIAGADCLIADLIMPDGDGIDLLRVLRSSGWQGPAILTSAFLNEAASARARACGFDELLSKPFPEGKLVALVKDLIGSPNEEALPA